MKKCLVFLLLFVSIFLFCPKNSNAYSTGNDFNRWGRNIQLAYINGFFDALSSYCIIDKNLYRKEKCELGDMLDEISKMEYGQMLDIFKKYLRDYPEKRNEGLFKLLLNCFVKVTGKGIPIITIKE
jgi:hypothetical protein